MTPKQRMSAAITLQPVDRLPTQINYTPGMGQILADHFGVAPVDLPAHLGNHFLRLDITHQRPLTDDGKAAFDWWGVGWSTETEGYWPAISPLTDAPDLDAYPWPDADAPDLLADAARLLVADAGQHFVAPNFGFALFERAWSLRGFENFSMDLLKNQGYAAELLDRITDIQAALARRFLALGVDGGYFGDDYGAQKNMLFAPRIWRALIKPRLARLFAVFREAGLPVILHSDGDIAPILPDLIEIGLNCLNPIQPEVHDLAGLKRDFGDRLAFYGGVSTQSVLPFGAPDEVRAAARTAIDLLSSDGTGLILAPSHRLTSEIPMANVEALLEVFSEL